jgi:GAF domain-containing protein
VDSEIEAAINLRDLYERICDLGVGVGAYTMAWVGLAEYNAEQTVMPVARAGFNSDYLETLNISWSERENGMGPAGSAIREGETQVINGIRTAPAMRLWRMRAVKRGYQACIALPLQDQDGTFGALFFYAREEGRFDEDEVEALITVAQKVSAAVMRLRLMARRQLIAQH